MQKKKYYFILSYYILTDTEIAICVTTLVHLTKQNKIFVPNKHVPLRVENMICRLEHLCSNTML